MNSRFAIASAACAIAIGALLFSPRPAAAQAGVPGLPAGAAVLRGVVETPGGPAADVEVVLYALSAQGHPGLGKTTTDASGRFAFERISNDASIAYLLGARYANIPFSRRVGFGEGQSEVAVRVEVSDPIADMSPVRVSSTRMRFDWGGSLLAVRVTQVLNNPTRDILYVGPSERDGATPVRVAALPAGATDFSRVPIGADPDLEQIGDEVSYWGPFFPGDQELTYSYLLPATPGGLTIEPGFPSGSGSLSVAYPPTGPSVKSEALASAGALELDGRTYEGLVGGAQNAGSRIALELSLPEMRQQLGALTLSRAELFLELDDASLVINQEMSLEVPPGAPLVAPPGEALLTLELPLGSQLLGMSQGAASMGVSAGNGAIAIRGPLDPGKTLFGFKYAIAVQADRVDLDLRFPLTLKTLRLHIADTGDLVVSSNRLHRLRPERSGTRTYLQREAFNVEPGERVTLGIARPINPPLPRAASLGLLIVTGALACLFLIRPLQRDTQEVREEDAEASISHARALVYASIHDLDHDFETGKISEADHDTMRAELRQSAIDLLRGERSQHAPVQGIRPADAATAATEPGPVPTSSFCPSCGGRLDAAWIFCSHCGGRLAPRQSASTGSGG